MANDPKAAAPRTGEAADTFGKDALQVLVTEGMPHFAKLIWTLLPEGVRSSMGASAGWGLALIAANLAGERLFTKAGGKWADMNDFRRDFMQEFNRIRGESGTGGGTEGTEPDVVVHNNVYHHANCISLPAERPAKKDKKTGKETQAGVSLKRIPLAHAKVMKVAQCNTCAPLLAEAAAKAAGSKKPSPEQVWAQNPALATAVMERAYSIYSGNPVQYTEVLKRIAEFVRTEAHLKMLDGAVTEQQFDGTLRLIEAQSKIEKLASGLPAIRQGLRNLRDFIQDPFGTGPAPGATPVATPAPHGPATPPALPGQAAPTPPAAPAAPAPGVQGWRAAFNRGRNRFRS